MTFGSIKPYSSVKWQDYDALEPLFFSLDRPLSGYLAGKERGGHYVTVLEQRWQQIFNVKHAIAVNSATSGLLAACVAAGIGSGDTVAVPALTMSATAAAPLFLDADLVFQDVFSDDFSMGDWPDQPVDALIVTNLFGHPARLTRVREYADDTQAILIEDNAQSPFAMEGERYAGTIGHMGVFSLNVHKHIQCGEGGIVVTNDDALAKTLRGVINHGEHMGGHLVGLNLRMPELCAAVALSQLQRGPTIIADRVAQARQIIAEIGDIYGVRPPVTRHGCTNVFYTIPFVIKNKRAEFCAVLRQHGVPIVEGYVDPLYRMPVFSEFAENGDCPVAERLHDKNLFYIENCAWDFTSEQIVRIGEAFREAAKLL